MIPNAPTGVDIRALVVMEQAAQLVQRTTWDDMLPVVLLLREDPDKFEVIHMQIIEDGQRSPEFWIARYAKLYGALVDLCDAMVVAYQVGWVVEDDSADGEPILTDHGVTATCVGHRHEEAQMVALFSRDQPSQVVLIDRVSGDARWEDGGPIQESPLVALFEQLMMGGTP